MQSYLLIISGWEGAVHIFDTFPLPIICISLVFINGKIPVAYLFWVFLFYFVI